MARQIPSQHTKASYQLDRNYSQPNFNSPPPLISIRDLGKSNIGNQEQKDKRMENRYGTGRNRNEIRALQQYPKQDIKRVEINQSKGVWNKQIPILREQKKGKGNNYRDLYFRNIKPVTQEQIKQEEKQESVIQSEYLQLEDLSSIQKYQSYLPNTSAFDYYQEYPHFLSPQNQIKMRQDNLRKYFDIDPHGQQESRAQNQHQNGEMPELLLMHQSKIKQVDQDQDLNLKSTDSVEISVEENSEEEGMKKRKGGEQTPELKINHQVFQQIISKRQKNKEAIEKITKQSYVNFLGSNAKSEEVIQNWEQLTNQGDNKNFEIGTIIERLEPKWFRQKTAEDSLRLILTKKIRLEDYLKYLSEIQIILEKRKFEQQIRKIQKKAYEQKEKPEININPKQKESQKQDQLKRVTIHYEHDSPKKYNENKEKQLILSNPKANKSSNNNIKSQSLVGSKYLMSEVSKYEIKDVKGKQTKSQFANIRHSLKNRQLQSIKLDNILAELIEEEKPRNSRPSASININFIENEKEKEKQTKNMFPTFDHTAILQLFAVLLVKISNKKCTVVLKEGQVLNENATLSSASRFRVGKADLQTNSVINPRIRIQFDQEVEKNSKEETSSSTVVENNNKKIKELTQKLENKDKEIEQLRSEYEHIINNYMTTISNLSKMKNSQPQNILNNSRLKLNKKQSSTSSLLTSSYNQEEKYTDEKKTFSKFEKLNKKLNALNNKNDEREEGITNRRQTEQFTFKNSKKGNQSRQQPEQIEWMGNMSDFPDRGIEKQMNNLRRSLPEKN